MNHSYHLKKMCPKLRFTAQNLESDRNNKGASLLAAFQKYLVSF